MSIRMRSCALAGLFTFWLSTGAAMALETRPLRYPVPGHGWIEFDVPVSWAGRQKLPVDPVASTIAFRQKSGPSFGVVISAGRVGGKGNPRVGAARIREQVRRVSEKVATRAVEKTIALVELKGASGPGYYFAATDSAPRPGDHACRTQGMIPVGGLMASFIVLTDEGQQRIVAQALAMLSSARHAPVDVVVERTAVRIPTQGWEIGFESPKLSKRDERRGPGGSYYFKADSGRFNVSVFVESARGAGSTHEDCYRVYWGRLRNSPAPIDKDSVVTSRSEKYCRVQYDVKMPFAGLSLVQRNVRYYLAFEGRWADVHISIIRPTAADAYVFAAFDAALTYGRTPQPRAGGIPAP